MSQPSSDDTPRVEWGLTDEFLAGLFRRLSKHELHKWADSISEATQRAIGRLAVSVDGGEPVPLATELREHVLGPAIGAIDMARQLACDIDDENEREEKLAWLRLAQESVWQFDALMRALTGGEK